MRVSLGDEMKKGVLLFGGIVASLVAVLALTGNLGIGPTGLAADASQPFDFLRSIQVGVVLLAAVGILVITLLNVTHHDE